MGRMPAIGSERIRAQLVERRQRLAAVATRAAADADFARLVMEVDQALARLDVGAFGICEVCHDTIEEDQLLANPLTRVCFDHLSAPEQRALEADLELAARIQRELLPRAEADGGWDAAYEYVPARVVSGDYCDFFASPPGDRYFILGDVSGKGVGASLMVSHLHAVFRTLVHADLPLATMLERASRLFCESSLPGHFATLASVRASADGTVEIANAGHPPVLLLRDSTCRCIAATGLPLGLFCSQAFESTRIALEPGDVLVLYSDGMFEARDVTGEEYGLERLQAHVGALGAQAPREIVTAVMHDVLAFQRGTARFDDATVLAVRWNGR